MDIVIADHQRKIRSALRLLLDEEPEARVVGEAADAAELMRLVRTAAPDVVLVDWELSEDGSAATRNGHGARLLADLEAAHPSAKVIVLSGRPEAERAAIAAGAEGFVCKGNPPECLLEALRRASGRAVDGTAMARARRDHT